MNLFQIKWITNNYMTHFFNIKKRDLTMMVAVMWQWHGCGNGDGDVVVTVMTVCL